MKPLFSLLLLLLLLQPAHGRVIDRIVAVVNDDIITLSELRMATSAFLAELEGGKMEGDGAVERKVLEMLIEERLILQAAERMGISVTERDVDRAIEEIKERSGMDDETFMRLLARNRMDYEDYRMRIRKEIIQVRLIERVINPRIIVTDEEVEVYYRRHKEEFTNPVEVRLRLIFLPFPEGTSWLEKERVRSLAGEIEGRLRAGEDFARLAREFSRGPNREGGGDIGYVKEGEMAPDLERVAFGLEPGQVSGPIELERGIYILQVMDRRGGIRPFEEVKGEIKKALFQRKGERMFREWIEDLKERSYIEVRY